MTASQLQPANGFTLKKGIKEVLTQAFQQSFQSSFWASLSPAMGAVVPQTAVLDEYPVQAYNHFPFIKLSVSVRSAVWTSINSNASSGLERAFTGEGMCMVDVWSTKAPVRDALFDSLLVLLLLRENTGADIFDEVLSDAWVNKGYPRITPKYGSVTAGSDDDGSPLPWDANQQLFSTSMSFDFGYIQSFGGLDENEKITSVKATPSLTD